MNRERAKELLKDVNEILTAAIRLRMLMEDFPKWDEVFNHFNLVDGIDEIRAKRRVLELIAHEDFAHVTEDDLKGVMRWMTQED